MRSWRGCDLSCHIFWYPFRSSTSKHTRWSFDWALRASQIFLLSTPFSNLVALKNSQLHRWYKIGFITKAHPRACISICPSCQIYCWFSSTSEETKNSNSATSSPETLCSSCTLRQNLASCRLAQQSQQPNNAWCSCWDSLRSWTVGTLRGLSTLLVSVPLGLWITAALFVNRRNRLFQMRSCSKHVVRCFSFLQKANLSRKVLDVCPDSRSKPNCLSLLYIWIWSYHISALISCPNLRLFGPLQRLLPLLVPYYPSQAERVETLACSWHT